MKHFRLVSVYDEKKQHQYESDPCLKRSDLLPSFERTVCFSDNRDFSFEELMTLFLRNKKEDSIGAISVIAEHFPAELYRFICDNAENISPKTWRFLCEEVIPCYLPLVLPKERLMDYAFSEEYASDIWVAILTEVRSHLPKT